MKVINEKGKLFGIINIIDLVVLLVLILVAGGVGYKFFGDKLSTVTGGESSTKDIVFTVKCYSRDTTVAQQLQVGDELVSLVSKSGAHVTAVSYTNAQETVNTADGREVLATNPVKQEVTVTVKMRASGSATIFKLGSQDVAAGKVFTVKTQKVEINGTVETVSVK